jgi:hypothetical protein
MSYFRLFWETGFSRDGVTKLSGIRKLLSILGLWKCIWVFFEKPVSQKIRAWNELGQETGFSKTQQ